MRNASRIIKTKSLLATMTFWSFTWLALPYLVGCGFMTFSQRQIAQSPLFQTQLTNQLGRPLTIINPTNFLLPGESYEMKFSDANESLLYTINGPCTIMSSSIQCDYATQMSGTNNIHIQTPSGAYANIDLPLRAFDKVTQQTLLTNEHINDIGVDLNNSIYLLKTINSSVSVLKSTDQGASWTEVLRQFQMEAPYETFGKILLIRDNLILVVGSGYTINPDLSLNSALFISQSSDYGLTWTTKTSSMPGLSKTFWQPVAATIDRNNVVHLTGTVEGYPSGSGIWRTRWFYTSSTDIGANWSNPKIFYNGAQADESIGNESSVGKSIEVLNDGSLLIGGSTENDTFTAKPVLQKSTDNGITWISVNASGSTANERSGAVLDLALDSSYRLYNGGWSKNPNETTHAVINRSSDNGVTWQTIFDYSLPDTNLSVQQVYQSPEGILFARLLGQTTLPTTIHTVLFVSRDDGQTWFKSFDQVGRQESSTLPGVGTLNEDVLPSLKSSPDRGLWLYVENPTDSATQTEGFLRRWSPY